MNIPTLTARLAESRSNAMTEEQLKYRKPNGQFKKGVPPFNKGRKMREETRRKLEHTWFQKGAAVWNQKPLGSERITKDGYVEVKITDEFHYPEARKNWRSKQLVVYEKAHSCKVDTRKDVVIFLDGDKRNFDIRNLFLISRAENRVLNTNWAEWNRHSGDIEIGMSAVMRMRIIREIRRRKSQKKE